MSAANVAMPPAVLRTIAPRPSAEQADDGQVEAGADTARATPGCRERDVGIWSPREDRLADEERDHDGRHHQPSVVAP